MKNMIGDECSVLHIASPDQPDAHSGAAHSAAQTLLCTDLVGSLSEDSVLQIISDSTTVAVTAKDLSTSATDPSTLGVLNLPILLADRKKSECIEGPEENVSDIDLSFLNEGIVRDPLNEIAAQASPQPLKLNWTGQEQEQSEGNSPEGDVVMIDVTKPIQLSQNSLIMVDGQKCVLQHDPQTGQVVAYPVKVLARPQRRRGRPRKTGSEQVLPSEKDPVKEIESYSEEEKEKGLLEVVNDDGSLVRRSSRKRKKAKTLKDYETGNLQQELGSDVDDVEDIDGEHLNRRRKPKGPGRPRKIALSFENISENSTLKDVRRPRGRPKKDNEATQAFLVQTADGQTLMLQVPLSSIPEGTTLQEMAQEIANKLNYQGTCLENKPILQDHSIGSTTNFSHLTGGIIEPQEITLECDQSLNDVTSAANLVEECNLNASESIDDNFCLDISSTTTSASTSGAAAVFSHFNEQLVDHSFYGMKPNSPKTLLLGEENVSTEQLVDARRDTVDFQLFQGCEVKGREESIVTTDSKLEPPDAKLDSSDPKDLFTSFNERKNVGCEVVLMADQNSAINEEHLTQELLACSGKALLLQESLTGDHSGVPIPEKSSPAEISSGSKKCKICAVPYFTEEEIVQHFKDKHPKCICLECNYMNEHPYGIKRHSYRHVHEECVCNICNKKYKDSYILKMHIKMVHLPPEILFKCDVCSKEFTRKAHLKRHQRIHAPVKQYQCPHCDYQGCEKSDVTKHLLIHEEPKFKCEFCGKAFRHLKNKELHIKRHSGQRDYKCAACNFYGYTYTDIRKHIERRHSSVCKKVLSDAELCKEPKKLDLCQSSLLEGPPSTMDEKKGIHLLSEITLDI